MADGLKLVNDIFERGKAQYPSEPVALLYPGVLFTALVFSDPRNTDLLDRLVVYCGEIRPDSPDNASEVGV